MSSHGERLVEEVKRVALADPDRVYQRVGDVCLYTYAGRPSCLVGHAMWNLGMIDADFENYDYKVDNNDGVLDIVKALGISLTKAESTFLCRAQSRQDCGQAWGEAIS